RSRARRHGGNLRRSAHHGLQPGREHARTEQAARDEPVGLHHRLQGVRGDGAAALRQSLAVPDVVLRVQGQPEHCGCRRRRRVRRRRGGRRRHEQRVHEPERQDQQHARAELLRSHAHPEDGRQLRSSPLGLELRRRPEGPDRHAVRPHADGGQRRQRHAAEPGGDHGLRGRARHQAIPHADDDGFSRLEVRARPAASSRSARRLLQPVQREHGDEPESEYRIRFRQANGNHRPPGIPYWRKVVVLAAVVSLLLFALCASPSGRASANVDITFADVTAAAGLQTRIVYGGTGQNKYILETTGTGAAFLDYDNDGWPDIFLVNGSTLDGFPKGQEPSNHLFRNRHDGTFEDVTRKAGLVQSGWGQGAAVADYDNDGFDDLFVTYWGHNRLYRNRGDGTFEDVTVRAGLAGERRWGTSAAFGDYDNDGFVDLYVANYIDFDPRTAPLPGAKIPGV